jgi:hypothetical protein
VERFILRFPYCSEEDDSSSWAEASDVVYPASYRENRSSGRSPENGYPSAAVRKPAGARPLDQDLSGFPEPPGVW